MVCLFTPPPSLRWYQNQVSQLGISCNGFTQGQTRIWSGLEFQSHVQFCVKHFCAVEPRRSAGQAFVTENVRHVLLS